MKEEIFRENVKIRIIDWMREERFLLREERDENAFFNGAIMFPPESGNYINIIIPKMASDVVVIVAGVGIDPRHIETMGEQAHVKSEFWWAVKFDLLRLFVDFTLMDEGRVPAQNEVHFINMSSPLHYDGLTKDSFMREIRRVSNARFMVLWRINQKFGEVGDMGV